MVLKMQNSKSTLADIGVLRLVFFAVITICLPLVFFTQDEPAGLFYNFSTYVAPVLMVLTFWLSIFDIIMSRVMKSDTEDELRKAHFRLIIKLDIMFIILIAVFWGPFFYSL